MEELTAILARAAGPHLRNRRILSLGIRRGDETAVRHFGRQVPDGPVFDVGSVTKVFTTSLLAVLAEEEVVRLEDPVSRFLPERLAQANPSLSRITLEALATRTSGLPRLPDNLSNKADPANPYAEYSVAHLERYLESCAVSAAPRVEYSNLGMGLLGNVLSRATGLPYERALRSRICEPLGMTDTVIRLSDDRRRRRVPGRSSRGKDVPSWDIPALEGAGALRSTSEDLLKFLDAHVRELPGPLQRALRSSLVARTPHQACLGWQRTTIDGSAVFWHNGATGGYSSYVAFAPSVRGAVVVLSNSGLSLLESLWLPHADRIGVRLIRGLLREK